MRTLLLTAIITITGCKHCWLEIDQKERERMFKQCMQLLPAGPKSTHYNDWDEVVEACDYAAWETARYQKCEE